MAKFCKYCGDPITEGEAFCDNCGKPIEALDREQKKRR